MITTITYTGDGSTSQFAIPFTYISEDYVKVKINGVETTGFTFVSSTVLQITSVPANGTEVEIYRETADTPLVTFSNASQLSAESLNVFSQQVIDLAQEGKLTSQAVADTKSYYEGTVAAAASVTEGRLFNAIYTSEYATFDLALAAAAHKTLILNSTVNITENTTVPATVSFKRIHPGKFNVTSGKTVTFAAGSVEFVEPEWFGAVGDWNGTTGTDDTTALQNTINAFPVVNLKYKTYKITASLRLVTGAGTGGHRFIGIGRANATGAKSGIYNATTGIYAIEIEGLGTYLQQHNQYPEILNVSFGGVTGSHGIRTSNDEYLIVERCSFSMAGKGITLGSINDAAQVSDSIKPTIMHNVFFGCTQGIEGYSSRVADTVIESNIFINCTEYAIVAGYLDGAAVQKNFVFSDLTSGTENSGIAISKIAWGLVKDNYIFEVNGYGMVIGDASHSTINDNKVCNTGKTSNKEAILLRGLTTQGLEKSECSGNTVYNCYGTGIKAYEYDDIILNNNVVRGAGYTSSPKVYDGIILGNGTAASTNASLDGNIVDGKSNLNDTDYTRFWLQINNADGTKLGINHRKNLVKGVVNSGLLEMYTQAATGISMLPYGKTETVTGACTQDIESDVLLCSASAPYLLKLHSAKAVTNKRLTFIKTDNNANLITIDATDNSETINGSATYTGLNAQYKRLVIVSDGTNWLIESSN